MENKTVMLTENQKETLQKLREWYCQNYSEDPIDGTNFDNAVLDALSNEAIGSHVYMSFYKRLVEI